MRTRAAENRGARGCQKRLKAFFDKELRPAAAHSLSAKGGQLARLRAEMYFPRRTEGELPRRGKRGRPGARRREK